MLYFPTAAQLSNFQCEHGPRFCIIISQCSARPNASRTERSLFVSVVPDQGPELVHGEHDTVFIDRTNTIVAQVVPRLGCSKWPNHSQSEPIAISPLIGALLCHSFWEGPGHRQPIFALCFRRFSYGNEGIPVIFPR